MTLVGRLWTGAGALATWALCVFCSAGVARAEASLPEVCTFVIDAFGSDGFSKDSRGRGRFYDDYLVRLGVFDVDADGIPDETQEARVRGSIGGDQYDTRYSTVPNAAYEGVPWRPDEDDSQTVAAPPEVRDRLEYLARWRGFGKASAWLPHGEWVYRVGFSDPPAYFLSYVSIVRQAVERPVCLFDDEVTENLVIAQGSNRPDLTGRTSLREFCDRFTLPSSLRDLSPTQVSAPRSLPPSGSRTQMTGRVWSVDFDSDGSEERLAELTTEAPGGTGAAFTYFRLFDELEGRPVDLQKVALLNNAQGGIDFDGVVPWFETVRILIIDGRVFFEIGPGGELPLRGDQNQHRILTVDGDVAVEVCYGNFSVKPKLLWSDNAAVPPQ